MPDDHRPQRNPGRNPFEGNDSPPLVDVKYRSGLVARAVNPNQRRWKLWPKGEDSFDIISWQLSASKDYEIVFPDDWKG